MDTEMGFPDLDLGQRMHAYGLTLRSKPSQTALTTEGWVDFLNRVTDAIGMYPVYGAKVWTYPVDGKGGQGQTIVLPITESFLALDTWPDHRGAYLFICSCKPFDRTRVQACAETFGLVPGVEPDRTFHAELNLT